jgi:CRP-like cAMP-binding protein
MTLGGWRFPVGIGQSSAEGKCGRLGKNPQPAGRVMMSAPMPQTPEDLLRTTPVFRRLAAEDRARLAAVSRVREYARNDVIFEEGTPSECFYTIAAGRVKITKSTPAGKDVLLEVFGPGDPFGAVAVYEGRPFPASAVAMEDTTCLQVPRQTFFDLLERHPSLVRGLLLGLTHRLIELTNRMAELTGGRVEPRFARLFLKLADESGRPDRGGVFVPLPLSRQELADMTGTTIETCIRIMSRWGKQDVVRTEKDGFVVVDRKALEILSML